MLARFADVRCFAGLNRLEAPHVYCDTSAVDLHIAGASRKNPGWHRVTPGCLEGGRFLAVVVILLPHIAALGNDAVIQESTGEEMASLRELLATYKISGPTSFRKVVSGRKLWNFDRKELEIWKAAL
jgi:hypothetical protein